TTSSQGSSVASTKTAPAKVTTLAANGVSASQIDLTWTASPGAASYNVLRSSTSSGTPSQIGTSATASFSDTGLAASTTLYYVVQAVNAAGTSRNSNQASSTTLSGGGTGGATRISF